MNNNKDESNNQIANNKSPINLNNDLQILDLSRNLDLKNLIEQPNSIATKQETHFNKSINNLTTSNLIDLNSIKQQKQDQIYLNDYDKLKDNLGNKLDNNSINNLDNNSINNLDNNSINNLDKNLDNNLINNHTIKDNRKFLTKDIDIFDFDS